MAAAKDGPTKAQLFAGLLSPPTKQLAAMSAKDLYKVACEDLGGVGKVLHSIGSKDAGEIQGSQAVCVCVGRVCVGVWVDRQGKGVRCVCVACSAAMRGGIVHVSLLALPCPCPAPAPAPVLVGLCVAGGRGAVHCSPLRLLALVRHQGRG